MKKPSHILAIAALAAGAALASAAPAQAGIADGGLNNLTTLDSGNVLGSLVNSSISDAPNNNANTKAHGREDNSINN